MGSNGGGSSRAGRTAGGGALMGSDIGRIADNPTLSNAMRAQISVSATSKLERQHPGSEIDVYANRSFRAEVHFARPRRETSSAQDVSRALQETTNQRPTITSTTTVWNRDTGVPFHVIRGSA